MQISWLRGLEGEINTRQNHKTTDEYSETNVLLGLGWNEVPLQTW
jgi:hypothetical protein